jgi:hypothetical protein
LATDLGIPPAFFDGDHAAMAARENRSGEVAEYYVKAARQMDPMGSDRGRAATILRLSAAAMIDPRQRAALLAARTQIYPHESHSAGSIPAYNNQCGISVQVYVLSGFIDTAYDLANQCLDETQTHPGAKDLFVAPPWALPLRGFQTDPRFQAFATRIGLMDYWQTYGPPDDCDLKDGKLTCH